MSNIIKKFKLVFGSALISFSVLMYKLNKGRGVGYCLYVCYKAFLRCLNFSLMPVVNADNYSHTTNKLKIATIENSRIGVRSNTVVARSDNNAQLEQSNLPDLTFQQYRDVCIRGNSDVIVDASGGCVVSDISYDLAPNEDVIDGLLYRTKKNICLLRDNLRGKTEHFESGIMISGKFCINYYHMMFENLIRLVYLDKVSIPAGVPIVMDRKAMGIPSCQRAFQILTEGVQRNVLLIDDDILYQFNHLYCISRINLLPSNVIDSRKPVKMLYYPKAMSMMRERLLKHKAEGIISKRFFITRKSGGGRQFNEEEVFSVLEKYGFERVAPEQLSFEEQMALFNNAEFIVSGTGAALTNLLFVSNKCTVVCFGLGSYDNSFEYPVFNTIANINGASFIYFPRKKSLTGDIHTSFEIDCLDFEKWIETMIFC